jgi:hypothetical protein
MYRYVEGLKIPPSGAMVLGRSGHETVEFGYREKKKKKLPPVSDMTEFFQDRFTENAKEEHRLVDGEHLGDLKDQGVLLVSRHRTDIAPHVKPHLIEEKWELQSKDFDMTGYWDLITKDGWISDTKFASRKTSQPDADKDLQLTIYAMAYRILMKKKERGLRLDMVIKTKIPKTEVVKTTRTAQIIGSTGVLIGDVVEAIKKENYCRTSPTNWWCSMKWCGYYERCMKAKRKIFVTLS